MTNEERAFQARTYLAAALDFIEKGGELKPCNPMWNGSPLKQNMMAAFGLILQCWEECGSCGDRMWSDDLVWDADEERWLCRSCYDDSRRVNDGPSDAERLDIEESMDHARERERRALGDAGR